MPKDETSGTEDRKQEAPAFVMPRPVVEVNGLGEITADESGIGALTFGESGSPLDTPVFGQPNYTPAQFPGAEDLTIDLDVETTTTTAWDGQDGVPTGPEKGVVAFAKKFLGTPYVWGGTTPTGFDCSGFTQYVMRKFGVNLPRISADQGRAGKAVSNGDLRPGDLVFWDNSSRNVGADHVGIYIGNGMFINAPRPGGAVEISHLYGDYWARRVL